MDDQEAFVNEISGHLCRVQVFVDSWVVAEWAVVLQPILVNEPALDGVDSQAPQALRVLVAAADIEICNRIYETLFLCAF